MVICLERGADSLHMVQLMHMDQLLPLHLQNPIVSCLIKSSPVLPFWYQLTQVVLENRPLNVCVFFKTKLLRGVVAKKFSK